MYTVLINQDRFALKDKIYFFVSEMKFPSENVYRTLEMNKLSF